MHLAKFFRAAVFFRGARVHQLHTWHNRATVALSTANLSPRCAFLGLGKLFPPVKSLSSVRTGEICIIFSSWLSSPEDLGARRKGGGGRKTLERHVVNFEIWMSWAIVWLFFLFWRYLLSFETLCFFWLTNIINWDCVIFFSFISSTKQ